MTTTDDEPSPFLPDYLPYLLQRADELLSRSLHADLQAEGVTVSEWRVLAVLRDDGPSAVGVLAEQTMLPQPTATHAVARLEQRGLVARRAGEVDRRRRIVALTARGSRLAQRLVDAARSHERLALTELPADDIDMMRAILARLSGP